MIEFFLRLFGLIFAFFMLKKIDKFLEKLCLEMDFNDAEIIIIIIVLLEIKISWVYKYKMIVDANLYSILL